MAEAKKLNIFEAINKTMADIGAIGKNTKNLQQGFMFRGIDAVMNALNPAMIKNGIFIVPQVLEQTREERTTAKGAVLIYSICKMKYTFYAQDGSSVEAIVIGEGMDSGDKATNKAMSIAFKYAAFQVFCIPTEEMKDPDAEAHEVQPKGTKSQADMKATEKTLIDEKKQKILAERCEKDNVHPAVIMEKCGVRDFSMLSEKQFSWICNNWSSVFGGAKDGK